MSLLAPGILGLRRRKPLAQKKHPDAQGSDEYWRGSELLSLHWGSCGEASATELGQSDGDLGFYIKPHTKKKPHRGECLVRAREEGGNGELGRRNKRNTRERKGRRSKCLAWLRGAQGQKGGYRIGTDLGIVVGRGTKREGRGEGESREGRVEEREKRGVRSKE